MKRRKITLKTKLAAALLKLGDIPYDDAKTMGEDNLISLYQWDHNILHAHDGPDAFWNIEPKLIREHREKTKNDIAIAAKIKRLTRKGIVPAPGTNAYLPVRPTLVRYLFAKHKWPSRKIPSRPFTKKKAATSTAK